MSMRVRVRFRYRAETGEVETFTVETIGADSSAADHDLRHDAAAASVARVVENNARIEEVTDADGAATVRGQEPEQAEDQHGPNREGPMRG